MSMSVNGGGGGGRGMRRNRAGGSNLAEINVTPFVDVVLVLLIIFMLTAHVMEFGIEVDVPQVKYEQNQAKEMPVITIDKTGDSTLNGLRVNIHDIVAVVKEKYPGAKGVYIRGDKVAIWDSLAQVIAEVGHGGLNVYMVTQPVDTAAAGH